ncbi:MAG TPA: glycosyltransferase family 4 protein [Acidimicrobiales bacterium]|nr:glycosyltransferase family 4 protein [Acidimicrobiales bacterium]HVZ78098.1 glycosyltransferase family 4 protein [Gemmatimonadaceae bacterium]
MGRLLVVSDTLAGGLGALVRLQAEWFAGRGWGVIVAAPADGAAPAAPAIWVEIPAVVTARRAGEMRAARRALHALQVLVDDNTVVHVHGMRSVLLARLAGLPTPFLSVHGAHPDPSDPPGYARLRRLWLATLPRLARRASTGEPGYPKPWVYEPYASPALRALDVMGLPSGEVPVIGWLGALDQRKQPEIFVRAIAETVRRGQRVRGLLGGTGDRGDEIAALIAQLGAPVEMLGQADPATVLRRSWALALFARSEGTPLAVMEAMWAGRTVVGSPVPGIELLVGDTGFIAGTVDAAADAFVRIATDRDATTRLGLAAAQRVRELVGPWTPWDTMEPIYRAYLATRAR